MASEFDIVDVRDAALLEQRKQFMAAAVEASHPGIRLRPDNEVQRIEAALFGRLWIVG